MDPVRPAVLSLLYFALGCLYNSTAIVFRVGMKVKIMKSVQARVEHVEQSLLLIEN